GGWQTVLPSTHSRVERLERAQLEAYERQAIESWATFDGSWSGVGKHLSDYAEAKKIHQKLKQAIVQELGVGGQGKVEKFSYTHRNRSVFLARKRLQHRRKLVEELREEANILERLCHDHIVRLIGTYAYQPRELYLILWPAATCDLSHLLTDLDDLRFHGGDRADILERLGLLDLDDTSAIDGAPHSVRSSSKDNCPLAYLQRITGCVTRAVDYCHVSKIRHLDVKPQNILLSPGRVYLADFGISRDVNDQDHTMTYLENGTRKWKSPERLDPDDTWSMQCADVYSLGLVFLNIATVLYGARQSKLQDILEHNGKSTRVLELEQFCDELRRLALTSQDFADETASTLSSKHLVSLTSRMLCTDPPQRPNAAQVNESLIEIGGLEQIYHSSCCKVPVRQLTQLLDKKYAKVWDERGRLAEENAKMSKRLDALEGREEMYLERIKIERDGHAKNRANLIKRLEDEQTVRKELEATIRRFQQNRGSGTGPRPGLVRYKPTSSGGIAMRTSRPPHQSPSQQQSPFMVMAATPLLAGVSGPRPMSPNANHRRESDLRKSTESLTNYALRSRGSGSRLPQPVNPSTPIRAGTPGLCAPRDSNLTDSTIDSLTSSMLSHSS
ncbi:kinase-like domain-containing protein, partial [Pseudomassariella vexata]